MTMYQRTKYDAKNKLLELTLPIKNNNNNRKSERMDCLSLEAFLYSKAEIVMFRGF